MKTKEQPSKKVLDISKPKPRRTAAEVPSAPPLVIPKRSVIVQTSEAEAETPPAEPIKARQVTVNIQPTDAQPAPAAPPPEPKPVPTPEEAQPSPAVQPQPAPAEPKAELKLEPKPVKLEPSSKTIQPPAPAAPEVPPTQAAKPTETPTEANPATNMDATTNAGADSKPDKENQNVRKALEDAKREEEIEGYIESHEFFVPINAVARKRSLRRSIALVFVELSLGLFLLNLMLDAGIIELLEKVPHTNFFDLQ